MDPAELLAQIFDAPRDLALRSVCADVLQAAGDPRGEFVALQLAGVKSQKIDQLLAKHWQRWLGPIGACTSREHVRFENGFASFVDIRPPQELSRSTWERIVRAREWATVERLQLTYTVTHPHEHVIETLLKVAPLHSLVELHLHHGQLQRCAPLRPLRALEITLHWRERFAADVSAVRGGELRCRREWANPEDPLDLDVWDPALRAGVNRLTIDVRQRGAGGAALVAELEAGRPRPPELEYRCFGYRVCVSTDRISFVLVAVAKTGGPSIEDAVAPFARLLPAFARASVRSERPGSGQPRFDGTGAELLEALGLG